MMPQDNWLQNLRERQQAFFAGGSPWGDRFQGGMPGFSKKGAGRAPDPAIPMVGGGVSGEGAFTASPRAVVSRPVSAGSRIMSPEVAAMLNAQGVMSIANPTPFRPFDPNAGAGMGNYGTGVSGTNITGASRGGGLGQALGGVLSNITSYMAGGVNAPNPGSLLNRAVAALSPAQGQPTAADRPRANPMR